VAESILELPKRLIGLDHKISQLGREKQATLAEYKKLVADLSNGHSKPTVVLPQQNTMRELVLTYLRQNAGVRLSLYEIERAIGAQGERRRLTWTLANMKRDGVIRHEGRGLWSVGKEDEVDIYKPPSSGDEDVPF
jgi:hypothetical protein